MKILIPGLTTYTLGSVPVRILATGLNYLTYEHPEPLDTSVEIDGLIYLVRFSELTATEGPGELLDFVIPRMGFDDTPYCRKARFAAVCVSRCNTCIYGRTRNENSYSRR